MNKHLRRLATALLAVLLLLQAGPVMALADSGTYQIRIYAGNVGATVNGSSVMVLNAAYGEYISFAPAWVQLPEDSPYYVRGIRKSGLDNNTVSNNVIHVTEDADYVVAYGIRGALVAYTVSYVDVDGNALAPSQTYYGNAGDKPVVAYLYVDGYQPQAYNLTRTLTDNEAGNVFAFVYTPIATPTPAPTATPGPTITPAPSFTPAPGATAEPGPEPEPGTEAEPTPVAGTVPETEPTPVTGNEPEQAPETEPEQEPEQAPETEPGQEPEQAPETEPEQEPEQAPETEPEQEQVQSTNEPQQLIDLDEGEAPLGQAPELEKEKTDLQKDREQKQTKFYVSAGLLAAALIAIVATAVVLLKKRGMKQ